MIDKILNQPIYRQHLYSIGLMLIALSILYLLAANWWMLPKIAQLATPQVLLLISAIASIGLVKSDALIQTLHTVCGLMLGLSLAVIGQVYQSGADSYLLFLLWSVLLLPWLYRKNSGILILLSFTGFLSLVLAYSQLGFSAWQLNVAVHLWIALLWLYAQRAYMHLNKYFSLWICIWSVVSMVQYFDASTFNFVYFISAFFMLAIAAWYEYRQQNALNLSMLSAAAGINLLIWLTYAVVSKINLGSFNLLVLVGISLGIFALLTKMILNLFPKSQFGYIPLFVGAWLSGLLLSAFVIGIFRSAGGVFIAGLISFPFALYQLKQKKHKYFMKQLYYCVLIFAQGGLYGGLMGLTKNPALALLVMIPLTLSCYVYRLSPWLLFVQLLSAYGMLLLSMFYSVYEWKVSSTAFSWIWYGGHDVLYALLLFLLFKIDRHYRGALLLSALLMIIAGQAALMLMLDTFSAMPANGLSFPGWGQALLFALWWLVFYWIFAYQMPRKQLLLWLVFSGLICSLGYFEIFLCMLVLAWALYFNNKLIYVFSSVALAVMLWLLYYTLNVTFLVKSISIFSSGIAVLILTWLLQKLSQHEGRA